jgi:hypothetical protein
MDFIFTDGLRGRSLSKQALDKEDDRNLDSVMDSVKTPRLPEIPNVLHADLTRSVSHLGGVRKFVIDNPKDQELKKRERLWQYHKKNRGAMVRLKGLNRMLSKSTEEKLDRIDTERKSESDNEVEKSPREAKKIPKIRARLKMESRNSSGGSNSESSKKESKESSKDTSVKYTYSSALTIGNSIYSQLRGKEQDNGEYLQKGSMDSGKNKRSIVNSIDKLPDLSSALTKLGYMKLTKNVVHYGGGFFGRHQDKRYTELRRSVSSIESCNRPDVYTCDNTFYGSMHHLDSMVEASRIKFETPRSLNKLDSKSSKENPVRMSEDSRKPEEKRPKPRASDSVKKAPFQQHVTPRATNVSEKSNKSEVSLKLEKCNASVKSDKNSEITLEPQKSKGVDNKLETAKVVRPGSDISLDIPKDKYGPSSQVRDVRSSRSPWMYGVNPYRWTNKSAITDEDKSWVEYAMQNTDVIDQTAYDDFARTKSHKS